MKILINRGGKSDVTSISHVTDIMHRSSNAIIAVPGLVEAFGLEPECLLCESVARCEVVNEIS